MAKVKYYYDTKTLSYKKIERTKLNMLMRILLFISSSSAIALCLVLLFFTLFDSPKEKEYVHKESAIPKQVEVLIPSSLSTVNNGKLFQANGNWMNFRVIYC